MELVVISCLFCTQTKGGAAREERKRPLAAQTDDDSFTAPDWNTTINYGTLHVKRDSIKPAWSLMKLPTLPHRQTTGHKSLRAISGLI